MHRFLTLAELRARMGAERVDRLSADQTEQEAAITSAESEAASYLSTRYPSTLPAAPADTPEDLKRTVAAAAYYFLASTNSDQVSEKIAADYAAAVRYWRDVGRGAANLNLPSKPAVDFSDPQVVATRTADDLVFGNGGLDQW